VTACPPELRTVGRAAKYFPLVGGVLGLVLALTNYGFASYAPSAVLSVALIALWALATGGLHLEDVKDTFAVLVRSGDDADRGYDGLGAAAIVIVLLMKSAAAESMDDRLTLSLFLTPLLARWALLMFLYGDHVLFDGACAEVAGQITFWQVIASSAATLTLVVYFLGRTGLSIALLISLFALLIRRLLQRRGVLTLAHAGTIVELGETLSLVLLSAL
jgi:adenosylcobinamide-GDP ribazoletransferase